MPSLQHIATLEAKWAERWPHFKPEEILSTEQLTLFKTKGTIAYSFRSLDKLCDFRNFLGKPILVNHAGLTRRGARSIRDAIATNRATRGSTGEFGYTFHLWCAFDCSVAGMHSDDLYYEAKRFGCWGGIGVYDTFVHVDDRDTFDKIPITWDYRTHE